MPPKRSASSTATGRQAKKGRTSDDSERAALTAAMSTRWSAVSGSRNIDTSFKLAVQDAQKANTYKCICRPPFLRNEDDEDEDEDEDGYDDTDEEGEEGDDDDDNNDNDEKKNKSKKTRCDGGRSCLCHKPASEHPTHDWILTYGGYRKFVAQLQMSDLRNPDNFGMYTYNDHLAYGVLEIIQNLFLDYDEASSWQEQWWICEALILFLHARGDDFTMIDHGELADMTLETAGRLFLSMLSRLEAQNLLSEGSEVKNFGLIMALYIDFAAGMREIGLLEEGSVEKVQKPPFQWIPSRFDDYIHAYANKYGIRLYGVDDIEELTAELKNVSLPAAGDHLWDWSFALESYKEEGIIGCFVGNRQEAFGGDNLDITSWTSATRAKHNFKNKDPLGKKERDAIKEGQVLTLA